MAKRDDPTAKMWAKMMIERGMANAVGIKPPAPQAVDRKRLMTAQQIRREFPNEEARIREFIEREIDEAREAGREFKSWNDAMRDAMTGTGETAYQRAARERDEYLAKVQAAKIGVLGDKPVDNGTTVVDNPIFRDAIGMYDSETVAAQRQANKYLSMMLEQMPQREVTEIYRRGIRIAPVDPPPRLTDAIRKEAPSLRRARASEKKKIEVPEVGPQPKRKIELD